MRKLCVIGNWKLNGSLASIQAFVPNLAKSLQDVDLMPSDAVLCVPFPYLPIIAHQLAEHLPAIDYGAQDCSQHQQGAYTGEVSADMLADVGADCAIIGHSERRDYHNEGNKLIAAKFAAAQQADLTPILCVGETLSQRESGNALAVVESQLLEVIDIVGIEAFNNAVVAYEPVWAIGTGKTASAEDAQQMHEYLRRSIAMRNTDVAKNLLIVYGGSVKPANAEELFSQPDIDGGLIGGASLEADSFAAIVKAAKKLAS